ncbi:polysaccharide pyruvyl transferase family protein [Pseudidiomarina aestuarii]|uniref:polysaccharide pyruvyl transferase family protein n=1 Tax=Pseudidiomarina aestuarii TaxID=624146 RepID=UPI003A975795
MQQWVIEVKGISFANKGAELMLHAIQAQLEPRAAATGVSIKWVVEPDGPFLRRAAFGLWTKTRYVRKRLNWLAPLQWLPQVLREQLGLVNSDEIDLVLDASGFAYGDTWPVGVARDRLASTINMLNKQAIPVVLLPQAFGPFMKPSSRATFKIIATHADKIYARDEASQRYVAELNPQPSKLKRCPDFTNLVAGMPHDKFDAGQHQVCIIPNAKMIEKREDGDRYIHWLVRVIEKAQTLQAKPFFLIHEATADRALVEQIQQRLAAPIAVLDPQHALQIKWVIGQSQIVIGSRYHGLVSALAQHIPVIATGWSHKYQALLKDYDCTEALIELTEEEQTRGLHRLEKLLTDADWTTTERQKLATAGQWQRQAVTAMWDEVTALLVPE